MFFNIIMIVFIHELDDYIYIASTSPDAGNHLSFSLNMLFTAYKQLVSNIYI